MRIAKCVAVIGFAMFVLGTCQPPALAEIRPVTLTVAPGNSSMTQLDISVKFAVLDTGGLGNDEVDLLPQRTGAETTTGQSSDRSPLNGTLSGYYDSTNGIFQVSRANLGLDETGSYCPGDGEASFDDPTQGPGSEPNDDPAEECPYNELGELGYYVGATNPFAPGADGAALSVRETLLNVRGTAPITGGNNIDVLNWHAYVVDSEDGIDGYGATFGEGGTAAIGYDVSRLQEPEATIHFESEAGEVNEGTLFDGTFNVAGSDVTFNFPFYLPFWVYDPASEPDPDEYFRLFFHSVNETTGLNDQIVTTGTLGDALELGDANEDGKVDGLDVNIVSLHWQKGVGADGVHTANQRELHTNEHAKYSAWDEGDFDLNATTDETDLGLLVANFGAGAGGGSGSVGQVPEPGTAVLAAIAGCLMMLGTRRRGA